MGSCKKDITPLLTHWSYVLLALTHQFIAASDSIVGKGAADCHLNSQEVLISWFQPTLPWYMISIGWCKKDVTAVCSNWSYAFLAPTHRYLGVLCKNGKQIADTAKTFHALPDRKSIFYNFFPMLNMIIWRIFIGPLIFFTGPPTFSSVEDRGLTSFAKSAEIVLNNI